jgi:hypothetical protein
MTKPLKLPSYIIDVFYEFAERRQKGLPITDGERDWLAAELATYPHYNEWLANDLLDKALSKTSKAVA